jgi:antitoxin HicB
MSTSKNINHSGSTFDSFLEEEHLLEDAEAVAVKRVVAWQLNQAMKTKRVSKKLMAEHLKTSRSQVDRLLDPAYVGISLEAVSKAAHAVGKRIQIELVDAGHPKRSHSPKSRQKVHGVKRTASSGKRAAVAAG